MKKLAFFLILIFLLSSSVYPQNKFGLFPYVYNSFTKKSNISWAVEYFSVHKFQVDTPKSINIHSYLVNGQKKGSLKSYLTKEDFEIQTLQKWAKGKIGDYFTEINYEFNNQSSSIKDSIDLNMFHEIIYLEDHVLKSHVVAAAPLYSFVTSDGSPIGTGKYPISYLSLNYFPGKQNKRDDIYNLGSVNTILNVDSIESVSCLKKTYSMSLSYALWYGLTEGFNKVKDLKTDSIIPPSIVIEYSPFDSLETYPLIDTTPLIKVMEPGGLAYLHFSNIEIVQEWFYDRTKDIFFNNIIKAYLYLNYTEPKTQIIKNERRFEITFSQ